jgi:coenzyme F420 hydrogenase subunit beta
MVDNIKKENTVKKIVQQGLCIGCGTCAVLCPKNALSIVESQQTGTYLPRLDDSKCNQCGVCLKICPGNEPNFESLNLAVFDKKPRYPILGNYFKCYSGYSANQNTRFTSTSGGLVSTLAAFALQVGLADGVLITRANKQKPLKPHSFIARTVDEVMSAAGSKYCPVPANSAFDEILKTEGRYIIIGLPCHVQGLRKAQALNKELKKRVSLVFGLVCNHTPTFHATDFLLQKFKIPIERIVKLDYRTSGWPGNIKIIMNDLSQRFIPFTSSYYWGYVFQKFFWPKRCMVCNDKLCQLADIIFMDAWLPEFSSDKIGSSILVTRSRKGETFIIDAIEKGVINVQPISVKDVERSQQILKTIRRVTARRYVMKHIFKEFSDSDEKPEKLALVPSIFDLLGAFHLISINRLCRNDSKLMRFIIECHVKLWDSARSIKKKLTKK